MSRKVNDLKAFFKRRLSSYTFGGSIAPSVKGIQLEEV